MTLSAAFCLARPSCPHVAAPVLYLMHGRSTRLPERRADDRDVTTTGCRSPGHAAVSLRHFGDFDETGERSRRDAASRPTYRRPDDYFLDYFHRPRHGDGDYCRSTARRVLSRAAALYGRTRYRPWLEEICARAGGEPPARGVFNTMLRGGDAPLEHTGWSSKMPASISSLPPRPPHAFTALARPIL